MFLKLTHRRLYEDHAGAAVAVPAPVEGQYESQAVKRLLERLAARPRQRVLELGVVAGEAVTTLAEAGAVVRVHDVITSMAACLGEEEPDFSGLLADVPVAPRSVDVVLAWELFDLLPFPAARLVLAEMAEWLAPKGVLIAVFHFAVAEQYHRFRLAPDGVIRADPVADLAAPSPVVTNSEMSELFKGFKLIHSSLVRGQVREVMVQRRDG